MAFPFYLQFRRDGARALCAGVFAMLGPSPVTVSPAPLPQLTRCDLLPDDFLRRQSERPLLCSSPSRDIPVPARITPSQRPAAHFTRQHGLMCSSCLDTGLQSMVPGAAASTHVRAHPGLLSRELRNWDPAFCG